jgi:hypothetical protein
VAPANARRDSLFRSNPDVVLAWIVLSTWIVKTGEITSLRWGSHVEVVVVVLFMIFAGVVTYIIRPRNRRQSRRAVALSAAIRQTRILSNVIEVVTASG